MPDLLTPIVGLVVFIFSVTLHEAAHALVAMWGGDLTAYRGGQVTLNPIPHIKREPFGMVVVPLISTFVMGLPLGWASAPIDTGWAYAFPRRAAFMAIAGPASNLLLALLTLLLLWAGLAAGWFEAPAPRSLGYMHLVAAPGGGALHALGLFLSVAFSLNLLLTIFNLLPVPPLDGATAVAMFLPPETARNWFQTIWKPGGIGAFGIVIAWVVFPRIFQPVWHAAMGILHPGVYSW